MTLHLRYVELRPLGADSTAIGTLSHRWFRMPAPISEVAKLIESLHLYNGDSADAAPEATWPITDLLLAQGSMVNQQPGSGTRVVAMTGTSSLCGRIRRADASGLLHDAAQLPAPKSPHPARGVLVAAVGGADSGLLHAIERRYGETTSWVPLRIDAGRGWLGPMLLPDGVLTIADLLARFASTDSAPAPTGPTMRMGAWQDLPEPEFAWIVSTIAALLGRYLTGEDCRLPSRVFELDPASFTVTSHLVLPMPLTDGHGKRAWTGQVSHTAADLIDDQTGIVTKLTEVQHHTSIPKQLKTMHAHVASIRRITPWLTDPVTAGSSFTSWNQARQAAIGEAVERYCGNIIDPARLRLASWHELAAAGDHAVAPDQLVLFSAKQHATRGFPFLPMTKDLRIHWVRGRSLTHGKPAWLPASLVYANWHTGPYADAPHTNNPFYPGLAAGPNLEFALMAAIQEIVERHITMVWWANSHPLASVRPTEALAELWRAKDVRSDQRAWLIHLDNEFSIPVFAGFVEHLSDGLLTVGFGARPDPEQAAFKAFAEALTLQDGARDLQQADGGYRQAVNRGSVCGDHVKPWRTDRRYLDDYRPDFRDVIDLMSQLQISLDPRAPEHFRDWVETPQTRDFSDIPVISPPTLEGYQSAIAEKGFEIFYADVTTHDVAYSGMRVVRAIIPGLVPNFAAGLPFQGRGRLRQAAVDLGWRETALGEDEINLFPMPHA